MAPYSHPLHQTSAQTDHQIRAIGFCGFRVMDVCVYVKGWSLLTEPPKALQENGLYLFCADKLLIVKKVMATVHSVYNAWIWSHPTTHKVQAKHRKTHSHCNYEIAVILQRISSYLLLSCVLKSHQHAFTRCIKIQANTLVLSTCSVLFVFGYWMEQNKARVNLVSFIGAMVTVKA